MDLRSVRRHRGIKQITEGLATLDAGVFRRSPLADLDSRRQMPPLTRAADHSKLWFAIGGSARVASTVRAAWAVRACSHWLSPASVTKIRWPKRRAAVAAELPLGADLAGRSTAPDVEFPSLRPFGERRGVRGWCGAGELCAGAGAALPAGLREVLRRDRRPLPRRRLHRLRHRCVDRRARRSAGAADRHLRHPQSRPCRGSTRRPDPTEKEWWWWWWW